MKKRLQLSWPVILAATCILFETGSRGTPDLAINGAYGTESDPEASFLIFICPSLQSWNLAGYKIVEPLFKVKKVACTVSHGRVQYNSVTELLFPGAMVVEHNGIARAQG